MGVFGLGERGRGRRDVPIRRLRRHLPHGVGKASDSKTPSVPPAAAHLPRWCVGGWWRSALGLLWCVFVELDGEAVAGLVEEVDIALWEGDGDVVFAEEGVDLESEVGLDLSSVEG